MVESERHENALPPGSMLEEYRIEGILGRGGFGITYLGFDTRLATRVAIKEYFPTDFAHRRADGTVVATATSMAEDYTWGLERFLEEARTLARFRHPNIVSIYRFIEARGTAYLVMEYLEGDTVAAVIRERRAELTQADLDALLSALLSGLSQVHAAGILHRDIKPANIAIRRDGTPVLFDFGSARQALGQHSRAMTAMVSYGYSPFEQYSARGRQGPWTDIYALGAVMYACVTGAPPPDAADRVRDDPYVSATEIARGRFSETLLRAIDWALKFDEIERPQSIEEWQTMLRGDANVPTGPRFDAPAPRDNSARRWIAAAIALVIIAAAAGGWAYWDYRAGVERAAAERAAAERTAAERADQMRRAEETRARTAAEEARRRDEAEAARARAEELARAEAAAAEEARRRGDVEAARKSAEEAARAQVIAAEEARRRDEAEAARQRAEQEARAKAPEPDGKQASTPVQQAAVPPAAPPSPWKGATTAAYRGELKSPARAAPYRVVTRFTINKDSLTGSYSYVEDKEEVRGTLDRFRETGSGKGTFRWRDRYGEGTLRVTFGTDMQSFQADWDVSGHPGVNGTWTGRR